MLAVWTVEQTRAFSDHVSGHRLYGLFHLVVLTGLRRDEAVGLRRPDNDLVRGPQDAGPWGAPAPRGGLAEGRPPLGLCYGRPAVTGNADSPRTVSMSFWVGIEVGRSLGIRSARARSAISPSSLASGAPRQ